MSSSLVVLVLELFRAIFRQVELYQDAQKREQAQQELEARNDHHDAIRADPAAELRRRNELLDPELHDYGPGARPDGVPPDYDMSGPSGTLGRDDGQR